MSTPSASVLVKATGHYSPGGEIVSVDGGDLVTGHEGDVVYG